jgi:hypothetical protein
MNQILTNFRRYKKFCEKLVIKVEKGSFRAISRRLDPDLCCYCGSGSTATRIRDTVLKKIVENIFSLQNCSWFLEELRFEICTTFNGN